MNLITILIIVVLLFIGWNVLLYFLKQRMSSYAIVFQIAGIVLFVLFIIFISFVYKDAYDVVSNFQDGKNTFMLADGTEAYVTIIAEKGNVSVIDEAMMETFSSLLKGSKYKNIKGDSYKLVIIKREALESMKEYSIDTPFGLIGKEDAISLLLKESLPAGTEGMAPEELHKFRAYIFADMISKKFFSLENQIFLVESLKKKSVIIYPDSLIFRIIRILPLSWIPETALTGKAKV